ncbi:MAG: tryptophan-rich sensory protein [Betaproteobacteria bacterium]|jgi:tryptophan-rich sensory protein|nr:tryptophan-rich sensory protein [Betaproteobacteria bacterium]
MTSTPTKPYSAGLFRQIAIAVVWVSAVSIIGQRLTDLGPWYQALRQPEWKPPDWAFGAIWTTVFALIVAAGVLAWRRANSEAQRRQILGLFAINSLLHMLWSGLFFTAKRPDWAMVELVFLWLSIAAIMALFWKISRPAFLLLLPYIGWVTIAGFLNYANVVLNGPFDGPTIAPTATEKSR